MADKSVSIDLIIKSSEAASSLKEVKQSLKDIKDAMIGAGEGTPEFLKLARAAGELKDKVDDSNEAIKAMNPNKFQAVATFASSAAGGISAVTGAMGLFGEQSEEVTKTLAKVQSAMALSQGLASLSELPKAWNALKAAMAQTAIVQRVVNAATAAWNAILALNPIGLVIAGIVALTGAVYLLTKAFSESNKEQEQQIKLKKELNTASIEGAKNAAVERNNLDNLYKASTDQTKSIDDRKKAQIELQKTYPLTFQNFSDEDFALGKAKIGYDNLSKSILDASMLKAKQGLLEKEAAIFAEEEQERLIEIAEARKQARLEMLEEQEAGEQSLLGGANQQRLRRLEEENAKEAELFKKKNAAILGDLAQHIEGTEKLTAEQQAAKDKEAKDAKDKADADALKAKNAADYKAGLEAKKKLDEANHEAKSKLDEEFRRSQLTKEQQALEDFKAQQLKYLLNGNITKIEFANNIKAFEDQQRSEKLKLTKIEVEDNVKMYVDEGAEKIRIAKETEEKIARDKAEQREKDKAARQASAKIAMELALTSINALQSLSDDAFKAKLAKTKKGSKEEEEILRKQFKVNKAMNMSTAIINAAQAQLSILAQYPKFDGGFAMVAAMVGAGITSLASIAKIASTQFDTTSVGNEPPPSSTPPALNENAATATSNSQPSTLLNPDGTVNNQSQLTQPVQVYVVESDITSTQQKVNVVQNQMSFQ